MESAGIDQQLARVELQEGAPQAASGSSPSTTGGALAAAGGQGTVRDGPQTSTSAAAEASTSGRPTVHCFHETTPEAVIYFQIINLGRQLYIWISVGSPKLENLYFAIQSRADPLPSVATLWPGASTSAETQSLAQRLAKKLGMPVMCSCQLPANTPILQVLAEKRLLQELSTLGLLPSAAAAGGQQQQPS